jgi:folate-binding protein YgfZ
MMNSKNLCAPGADWGCFWRPAAVLRVGGEDALAFLQGQFSQDLRFGGGAASAGRVAHGLWLTHKGRVLADSFALVAGPAEVWLVSYFSVAADIRAHLEKHIVADDVAIEDRTADWHGLAVGGASATAWLRTNTGAEPPGAGSFARAAGGGLVLRGRRGTGESWEWLAPVSAVFPSEGAPPKISAAVLERMRLAAGVPAVPADIGPGDLPHEGGLDADAVSYTKGCYVGQEVMARLRTGTIRRRLTRVRGPGTPPSRGAALFQGAKKIGELRSTCPDDAGGWIGLALLTLLQLDAAAPLAPAPDAAATIRLVAGGL